MYEVKINYGDCEDNRFCYEVCPEDVFEVVNGIVRIVREENCTGCNLCVENCPTMAVSVE
jgi:NAD-dependent dihydropyrimidine dehydrogenase PreA subunit